MNKNKVLKATFIVMVMTILSRAIGFIRDILAAGYFGATGVFDIYVAAVAIPESVFMIVGLAISTTFIPMLSEIKHKHGKEEMFKFSNNVISLLSIISIIILILGLVFTEDIVKRFVLGFDSEQIKMTVFLTRITLINIFFLCVNACFSSILQVCEDFIVPSLLGLFFNLPIIVYLIFFKDVSIVGLTIANVIGNICRVAIQIPSLYGQGYRINLFIDLKDEKLKKMLLLILPVIVGAGANSINMLVDKSVASTLVSGSMAALDFAQKIVIFVNTAITTSIVSVIYPVMANRLNAGDKEGFIEYLSKSIVIICLFLVPITMGSMLLSKEVVQAFYQRGVFDVTAVTLTSLAFFGYAIQLPFAGVRDVLNSSLFSMKKTKITTINGIIGVVVNIVLSITLSRYIGVLGIAIATTTSSAVTAILLFNSTRKLIGNFNPKPMIIKILKIIISSIIMIVVVYFVNKLNPISNKYAILVIDAIIGAIVFSIVCIMVKIEEFNEAILMITNKIKKKAM